MKLLFIDHEMDGAAEISYRGVTFAEVEAWAWVAVKDPAGARRREVV